VLRSVVPWAIDRFPRLVGPFAFQASNETRYVEFPWAFHAAPVQPGSNVVEIGGGLTGFQFVLSKCGARVINVDPGGHAPGITYRCEPASIERLNRAFGTDVVLEPTTLEQAGLPDESADVVYSISTIEHIHENELPQLAREIRRIVKPGGRVVLTIDLFLNVAPFTQRLENRYGWNIDVKAFVDETGLEMIVGDEQELNGYGSFDPDHVLAELARIAIGTYPACAQMLVLKKPR
jgi:SAM-dependent methyltransferase